MIFYELNETVNANTLTSTSTLEVRSCEALIMYVIDRSGSHNNHIIKLEASPNNIDWMPYEIEINGVGCGKSMDIDFLKYVRASVTTKEGSTSEVEIFIQAISK